MKISAFKSRFKLLKPAFGLFFVVSLISCAGNGQPLTESAPKTSEGAGNGGSGSYTDDYFDESSAVNSDAGSKSARKNTANSFSSDGFSFILPQSSSRGSGDWALVGDDDGSAHESGVPDRKSVV